MIQIVDPKALEFRQIPCSTVDLVVSVGSCVGGSLLALSGLGGAGKANSDLEFLFILGRTNLWLF